MSILAGNLFSRGQANAFYILWGEKVMAFDLIRSEEHSMVAEVTEHPIDAGSAVATHIHNRLREGTFEGLITNWSTNTREVADGSLLTPANRAKAMYSDLEELYKSRTPVKVVVGLQAYEDCVITRIGASRDSGTGDAQPFSIAFKQIRRVATKVTKLSLAVSSVGTGDAETQPQFDGGTK